MSEYKTFTCSYRFDGGRWNFSITAKDWAEATQRMEHLKFSARIDGEHVATIPAFPGAGLLVRALIWLRGG